MALLMGASMAIAMLGFISDLARNMARFYVLTIDPTLFGETALVSAGRRGPRPGSSAKPVVVTSSATLRAWSQRATRRKLADLDKISIQVYQSNTKSYSVVSQELRKYSIIFIMRIHAVDHS